MSVAAIFPERVLCADEVLSRFGGVRVRLIDGPRRVDPVGGVVVDNDVDGIDLARWLSRPRNAGQARRAAALVRRLPDAPTMAAPTTETLPSSTLWAAWCAALLARGVHKLAVLPRLLDGADVVELREQATAVGMAIEPLLARTPRPILFLDDSELLLSPSWRVVADAGQGALLATGLAADVVAVIVEAAGVDGAEVWSKGFDDVARQWFTQRIERAIRAAITTGSLHLHVGTVLPPLSASTSKLAALSTLPTPASPKALTLAKTLRERQLLQWQSLARIVVELRVPAARPQWWAPKLAELALPDGPIDLVAAPGVTTDELIAALAERGTTVDEPTPSWLHAIDDADDSATALLSTTSLPAPPSPPRAVGGVRAGGDFAIDESVVVEPQPLPPVAPSSSPTTTQPVDDGRVITVPAQARAVRVRVDGDLVPSSSVVPLTKAAVDGPQQLRLPDSVRFGSVVVVSWDVDDAVEVGS